MQNNISMLFCNVLTVKPLSHRHACIYTQEKNYLYKLLKFTKAFLCAFSCLSTYRGVSVHITVLVDTGIAHSDSHWYWPTGQGANTITQNEMITTLGMKGGGIFLCSRSSQLMEEKKW